MNRIVGLYAKVISISFLMNLTLFTLIVKFQGMQTPMSPEESHNILLIATPKLLINHIILSFLCLPFFLSQLPIVTGLNEPQRRVVFFSGPFFMFVVLLLLTNEPSDTLIWTQFTSAISLSVYAYINSAEIEFDL